MKIALVCSTLGYSWRGLEKFTLDLFDLMSGELPMTLFGNRLNGRANQVSLPCPKADRWLSIFKGRARDNYYFQQFSYALIFIPYVVLNNYDLIHYSEPGLGNFLWHTKKRFKFKYKILFTNWGMTGPYCERPDHLQEITLPAYHTTIEQGISSEKATFLPYGLKTESFRIIRNGGSLREKYGVPKDKIVILCVAALNRRHKRIDYLIREVSRLGEEFFLLVVGHPEEPDLIQLGETLMGERFKSIYVPFEKMPAVYALADIFVMSSLIEGFCLALAEAMCAGLPIIAHDFPNFQWLVEEKGCLSDLSREGNLVRKIREVVKNRQDFQRLAEANRERTIQRFDWENLKPQYLEMYEKVLRN